MWVAHYGFHLLTGAFTIVPVVQSALVDLSGRAWLGEPDWRWSGMRPGLVFPLQLGFIMLGAFGSLGLVRSSLTGDDPRGRSTASLPGVALVVALTLVAIWVLAQPMDMRGLGGTG
jgi:hypothetical protein